MSSYTVRLPLETAHFGGCLAASLQLASSPSFLLPAAESSSVACGVGNRSVDTESKAVPSCSLTVTADGPGCFSLSLLRLPRRLLFSSLKS